MRLKSGILLFLLLMTISTSMAYAIDAAEAYQNAISVDQTNTHINPIGQINSYFEVMANEAFSTGNMKIIDNMIYFPIQLPELRGMIIKNLRNFKSYQPAIDYLYNNINDPVLENKKWLCITLTAWGDYDAVLDVADEDHLWQYYFNVPHQDMFKIATKAANDETASYEKRQYAAYYLLNEHGDSQTWSTVAREILENAPTSGLSMDNQRAKICALDRVIYDDPDYVVTNSHILVNDENKLIQMNTLLFLDYQESNGHPDALAKLLYISENANEYKVRVTARKIYNKYTN